jgi:hypothetical protein
MRKPLGVLILLCFCAEGLWAQSAAQPKQSGTVQVLYAGSLGSVLEKSVGSSKARDLHIRERGRAPWERPK